MEYEEDRANLDDPEVQKWFTELELEIIKNAMARIAERADLTIVEEVMWREYTARLKAIRHEQELLKRPGIDDGV